MNAIAQDLLAHAGVPVVNDSISVYMLSSNLINTATGSLETSTAKQK